MRRGLLTIVAAMLLASGVCHGQTANPYPTRQVRIVVPYPAGGPTDLIARLIAQKLGERLGQSFFVENVAGASGAIGAGQVAHAAPDGYTLLVSTNDFAVASVTNTNLPYDPVKNFLAGVSLIATSPQVVAVNPSVPAKTMKELVDIIKAAPEKYNYAAIGIGFGQLTWNACSSWRSSSTAWSACRSTAPRLLSMRPWRATPRSSSSRCRRLRRI